MSVTKKKVLTDFNKLVAVAERLFTKKKHKSCISAIKTAASLMYNFNIVYTDERLENLLHKLGDVFVPRLLAEKADKTVLFYDWWCWETRGLSTIYIKALLANGYKAIVITPEHNKNTTGWLKELLGEQGCIEFYEAKASCKNQFERIADIYNKHKPLCAFFHSMPNDVTGCVFFSKIPCTRYQINLTDHAFWLGATCLDYSIEFRDYGYSVSKEYRHIPEDKLIVLPYYPVRKKVAAADSIDDFFDIHKNIVFSGGSLYKIAGSPVFFEIVSYILDTYKDSTFVFIGGGNSESIRSFISQKGYENRLFYFAERPDFEDFIRHSKFCLNTYPNGGGLICQLAVINDKMLLSYTPNTNTSDVIHYNDGLFIDTGHNPIMSYKTLAELKKEIGLLLTDDEYRMQKEKLLKGMVITEADFTKELKSLLENNMTKFQGKEGKPNIEEFAQMYIDAENNTNHNYANLLENMEISFYNNPYKIRYLYKKCRGFAKRILQKIWRKNEERE